MPKRQVFFSFHFENDVFRTQQVRNIGVIEGDKPVSPNEWETARKASGGVEKWIDDNIKYKSCVVVLVGSETASRPLVRYEIKKVWEERKGLVGIYIHNLKDPRTSQVPPYYGKCPQGQNPFLQFNLDNGRSLSRIVKCYNPNASDTYNDIANNIENWVEEAIKIRQSI